MGFAFVKAPQVALLEGEGGLFCSKGVADAARGANIKCFGIQGVGGSRGVDASGGAIEGDEGERVAGCAVKGVRCAATQTANRPRTSRDADDVTV